MFLFYGRENMGEKVKNGQFIKKWQIAVFALIYLLFIPIGLFWTIVNGTDTLAIQIQYEWFDRLSSSLYLCLVSLLAICWIISPQYRREWKFNLLIIPVFVSLCAYCYFGYGTGGLYERFVLSEFAYDRQVYLLVEYVDSSTDIVAYQCNEWGMFCERISNEDYERVRAESRRE